jgi:hypothetical protein
MIKLPHLPDALGGRNVGAYKGHVFRSLLEYSFYKHLERQGYDLSSDVVYEPYVVSYTLRGKNRSYHPDFLLNRSGSDPVLVEVKNSRVLAMRRGSHVRRAQFEAATKFAAEIPASFRVVTEKDFIVFTGAQAARDPGVEWVRRAARRGSRRRRPSRKRSIGSE